MHNFMDQMALLELDDILLKLTKKFILKFTFLLCILHYFLLYYLQEDYLFIKQYLLEIHVMLVQKLE